MAGGDSDWGFRLSTSVRKGSDYVSGNGTEIPSSFESQDAGRSSATTSTRISTSTFPIRTFIKGRPSNAAQMFDITNLNTDAFNVCLTDDDDCHPWTRLQTDVWYNRTNFEVTRNKGGTVSPQDVRIMLALDQTLNLPPGTSTFSGTTNGDELSTGRPYGHRLWRQG